MTKDELRGIWRQVGDVIQGAPTNLATMPEEKKLAFLNCLLSPEGSGYSEAQISLACGKAGFPFEASEVLVKTLKGL